MLKFNIDIKDVTASLKNTKAVLLGKVEDEMNKFGINAVTEAKILAPVDEGRLRNSISYKATTTSNLIVVEVVVACDYAAYVEFGTRRFAEKYVSSLPSDWQTFAAQYKGKSGTVEAMLKRLTEWVLRKGLQNGSKNSKKGKESAYNTAYVIALNILRNGVRQHPFLYPAIQSAELKLKQNLGKL